MTVDAHHISAILSAIEPVGSRSVPRRNGPSRTDDCVCTHIAAVYMILHEGPSLHVQHNLARTPCFLHTAGAQSTSAIPALAIELLMLSTIVSRNIVVFEPKLYSLKSRLPSGSAALCKT